MQGYHHRYPQGSPRQSDDFQKPQPQFQGKSYRLAETLLIGCAENNPG